MQDKRPHEKRAIGHTIRQMHLSFQRSFDKTGVEEGIDEVTMMHGWIMGYLHHHKDDEIYQKTIESAFGIRRSTVTSIIQLMEKKGYIERKTVPGDARLKKIVLTPLGEAMHEKVHHVIDRMEEKMLKGLSPQEIEEFYQITDKIRVNLGDNCWNSDNEMKKGKEE